MSIHIGFPDLSNARRASLVRYIKECERIESAIVKLSKERKGKAKSDRLVNQIRSLKNLIKLQFPECRHDKSPSPSQAMKSTEIRSSINEIEKWACNVFEIETGLFKGLSQAEGEEK